MSETKDIIDFLHSIGYEEMMDEHTELEEDLGIWGDDMSELLDAYVERFHVDMTSYLWYFHTRGEGLCLIGDFFYPPPNKRVTQIPITITMLRDYANHGKWSITYPDHKIPKYNLGILIELIFLLFLILFFIIVEGVK